MRKINIPIFVPHKGCPNNCVFCNQRRITGVDEQTPQTAKKTIEEYIKTISKDCICQVAFFGGSFTAIDREDMIQYLELVAPYIKAGIVESIRISTRPDCIDDDIVETLLRYNVRAIELGVQSTNEEVLRLSKRGHSVDAVSNAVSIIKKHSEIELGLQMMVGLMGDTREKSVQTARDIINFKADTTRIYPTLVIKNSELEEMYKNGEYTPLGFEEAVDVCAELYNMFSENNVRVLRVGLMASDEICEGSDSVVAGPVHSSFGELVHSRIFANKISEKIKGKEEACVYVNPAEVSKAVGNKKCNLKYILEKYGCRINVLGDNSLKKGQFIIK